MAGITSIGGANGGSLNKEPKKQNPDTNKNQAQRKIDATREETKANVARITGLGLHFDRTI